MPRPVDRPKIPTEFADRLARIMKRRKLNARQLSLALGVTHRTVARWLHDGSHPTLDLALQMARILRVSLDELAGP